MARTLDFKFLTELINDNFTCLWQQEQTRCMPENLELMTIYDPPSTSLNMKMRLSLIVDNKAI